MSMPAAKGLFHRAIKVSGSYPMQLNQAGTRRLAAATVEELGLCAGDRSKLQVPADALIAAGYRATARLNAADGQISFEPGVRVRLPREGWGAERRWADHPEAMWVERAPTTLAEVPLIVGTVCEQFKNPSLTADDAAQLASAFGVRADTVRAPSIGTFPPPRRPN